MVALSGRLPLAAGLAVTAHALPAVANIIYVDAAAAPGGNGSSWTAAFRTFQDGLAAAGAGDEVRVSQGLHRPAPAGGPRTASFAIPSGVRVLGGYAGLAGGNPDLRDPAIFVTTLSGDLNGDDGPNLSGRLDNSLHVVTMANAASNTLLDGVTIRAGHANGAAVADQRGAGVWISSGSPTLSNCRILACDSSGNGAAARCVSASAVFVECRFSGNNSGGWGGAITDEASSATSYQQCVFSQNDGRLGGHAFLSSSQPTFTACRFELGTSTLSGGAVYESGSSATFRSCVFIRNTTDGGGGAVYSSGSSGTFDACLFVANRGEADGGGAFFIAAGSHPTLMSCALTGNGTGAAGGALYLNPLGPGGPPSLTAVNCTITANTALFQPNPSAAACGGLFVGGGSVVLSNSIFWGNTDRNGATQQAQLSGAAAAFQLDRNIVQGWTGSLGGIGCSGINPAFLNLAGPDGMLGTEDDDFRLGPASPCIDAGDNAVVPAGHTIDLLGQPRLVDDPNTLDTGAGTPPIVDRGAVEFQPPVCYANCDGSSVPPILNVNDYLCFQSRFAAGDPYANCDSSTTPPILNINDFLCFQGRFAAGCR